LYQVQKKDEALELSYKMFGEGSHHGEYIRYMVEMNKIGGGIELKPGANMDSKHLYEYVLLRYGFNIWVPSREYAYKRAKDNYLRKSSAELEVYRTVEKGNQSLSKFKKYADIIDQFSSADIQEFADITGTNWVDIVSAVGGVGTTVIRYLYKNNAWSNLNEKFTKKYGISADEVLNTLLLFRDMAVSDGLELIQISRRFAQDQHTKLNQPNYLKGLYEIVGSYKKDYYRSDLVRAEAIFKFFRTNKDADQIISFVDEGLNLLLEQLDVKTHYSIFKSYYERRDQEGLAAYLNKQPSDTTATFLFGYELMIAQASSMDLTLLIGAGTPSLINSLKINSKYPELIKANLMDKKIAEQRLAHVDDYPILSDPNLNWRDLANKNSGDFKYTIQQHLKETIKNCNKTEEKLVKDKDLVWELRPSLSYTMFKNGIEAESNLGRLILDKHADVEFDNMIVSIGLAVVGLALAIAGFFTMGATWAAIPLVVGGIAVSAIDLYLEVKSYQFHSAASHTGIGDIPSLSDKDPSIWGVVFAVIGLGIDFAAILKAFRLLSKTINTALDFTNPSDLSHFYKAIKETTPNFKVTEDVFVEQMLAIAKDNKALKHIDTVEILLKESGIKDATMDLALPYTKLYNANPGFTRALLKSLNNNPDAINRFAIASLENPSQIEALLKLGETLTVAKDASAYFRFSKVFNYLAFEGVETLNRLPTIMGRISKGGIKDPELINEIITNSYAQKVLLGEDPSVIKRLWDEWKFGPSPQWGSKDLFFRYLEKQNLPSLAKSSDVLVTESRLIAQQTLTESYSVLKGGAVNGVLKIDGKTLSATEDAITKALQNGHKIEPGAEGMRKFLETQMSIPVKEIDPKIYNTLLDNIFKAEPDLFIRNLVLKNSSSVSQESISKLVKIAESGDVSPEKLQRIFANTADQSVDDVIESLNKLITEKPTGWQKQLDELAGDPKKGSGIDKPKESGKFDEGNIVENELGGLVKDSRGVYGYLPKEGSRYYMFFDKFTDADWVARQRLIRQDYLNQSKVLEQTIVTMKANKKSTEQIARHVVEQRNLQKVEARAYMLPEEVEALEKGNLKRYGNPIGPSADDLFDSKGSWDAVIESSMKKDPEINTLLGL